ncbi:ABC transporter permease [Anaerocolumna sp. AGMB13020]|uniref:ABC transporter permease n=1 Tax=Anaerocolumna sp. AGMB13020 TaxID=3081750 RepID=UPI0029531BF1|nr:ABC transporter permease [Anaerocolumna sp. AGMB13020]WOO39208.1 ABC transporter permease [Anaerocolumna sp. AGMB13020]
MLNKIALRNAKRSLKDYCIYIISITTIFSLLYAFNMIVYSEDIIKLSDTMQNMPYLVTVVSVLIVLVSVWLVYYMNNFMFQRRSKEFGIYMSLGISNGAITRLFFRENIIIGFLSFLISLIAGSFLYQVLITIVMHVFEMPYEIKIAFSIKALLQTVFYVILIYSFSMIRSQRKLRKLTIYNLLYAEKKNETQMFHGIKGSWGIFIISLAAGIAGGITLWNNFNDGDNIISMKLLGISFLCMIILIYGFYFSVPAIVVKLLTGNPRRKYKKGIFLLVRSLSAKINTMRITLGTLSLLITLTLASFSIGIMLKGFFESQVESISPFDIAISSKNTENDLKKYKSYIGKNLKVEGEVTYLIYKSGSTDIYDLLLNTPLGRTRVKEDTFMKYSDYQKLRELLGYSKEELKDDSFFVQCVQGVKDELDKRDSLTLRIAGRTLGYQGCFLEDFALQGINGLNYLIVVPDEFIKTLEPDRIIYAANTTEKTTVNDYNDLRSLNTELKAESQKGFADNILQDDIKVKGQLLADSRSIFTILAFSLFYLGLVYICIAATILAVHHISDSVRYKFRYKILDKLGMEGRKIDSYILKQCLFYFGFPILLSFPIAIYIAYCFNPLLEAFSSRNFFSTAIMTSAGLFFSVYILYFIATFISYRKNVYE